MSIDDQVPPPEPSENGSNAFFWPLLVLIIGTLISTGYQIAIMQEQLGTVTQAVAQVEPKARQAPYARVKLYKLASDVLQLSATDPNARQIVEDYKIEQRSSPQSAGTAPSGSVAPAAK